MKKIMISPAIIKSKEKERISKYLESKGYEIVDVQPPYSADKLSELEKQGIINIELYYLSKRIELMSTCDAIFICSGFSDSKLCRIEFEVALEYNLDRIFESRCNIPKEEYNETS